jgi:hypothetical protein
LSALTVAFPGSVQRELGAESPSQRYIRRLSDALRPDLSRQDMPLSDIQSGRNEAVGVARPSRIGARPKDNSEPILESRSLQAIVVK